MKIRDKGTRSIAEKIHVDVLFLLRTAAIAATNFWWRSAVQRIRSFFAAAGLLLPPELPPLLLVVASSDKECAPDSDLATCWLTSEMMPLLLLTRAASFLSLSRSTCCHIIFSVSSRIGFNRKSQAPFSIPLPTASRSCSPENTGKSVSENHVTTQRREWKCRRETYG